MKKRINRLGIITVVFALIWFCITPVKADGPESAESIEVVATIPVETTLGSAGTAKTWKTWVEMINSAQKTIDIAQFYLSTKEKELLEPVITAIIKAADRGVKVRFLVGTPVNDSMAERTGAVTKRFSGHANIALTTFDWKKLTGSILHAKYFIVDRREAFVGSQNFDWRSLKHIHETGLRIKSRPFARALTGIFNADWQYNNGDKKAYKKLKKHKPLTAGKENFLVASPEDYNPPGVKSALKTLIQLLGNAQKKITIQLLTYNTDIYDSKEKFTLIANALRRAAARGVKIKMLVSDWNKDEPELSAVKELAKVPGIRVKFVTIPQYSKGFIPYARVIHSKVMRIDQRISWVGTSNWGYRYFFQSRNVEVVSHNPEVADTLDRLFNELWNSNYTELLDPAIKYSPPRIK